MAKTPEKKQDNVAGHVQRRNITEEMRSSYIDYAMSVIVARALPDVRDGLKPVQRRILYVMYEDGITSHAKSRKSANVVGACLGRYHPHGDQSVYDAMARMTQPFSLRYPMIQGQGNWGSIDDPGEYAAMRYTEAKLSAFGEMMLKDIEKDTVRFIDNYDGTKREPVVLPSPMPNLILNGSLGIAVGMATNIPPHNLSEICDALAYLLDHPKATTEDLFQFINGPDFPTGGQIFNRKEMIEAYARGKGPVVVRGKADVVDHKSGHQIIISEIPFQVQKTSLIEQFANLVQEKKVEGIRNIRDESDKDGMRIVVELKSGTIPQKILNHLYKFTDLQRTYHLNMLALVDGIQPRVLSLPDFLNYFLAHRNEVITRRTKFDLERAKDRAHILEGLAIALLNIDKVIEIIKKSKDREAARTNLMKSFKLSDIQANAILEIRLQQLARMERKKIEDELTVKRREIKELTAILKSPKKIQSVVKKELGEVKDQFGDERRTKVSVGGMKEISVEDLIPDEDTIVTLTKGGYIKRMNPGSYKSQQRGGKGSSLIQTLQDDVVEHFLTANTKDYLFFFTDSGKVFRVPAYEIPEISKGAKGRGLMNFLELSPQDKILCILPYGKEDKKKGVKYFVMATAKGILKKTRCEDFENIRKSGLIAINLKKGDTMERAVKTTGEDELLLVTRKGQALRFKEKTLKPMSRQAGGFRAIRLKGDDTLVDMVGITKSEAKASSSHTILLVAENAFGKRTRVKEYKVQNKGGSGIKAMSVTQKTGNIVFVAHLTGTEEYLLAISQKGQAIKIRIGDVPLISRITQGVRLMRLADGEKVVSVTYV